ncbi:MAG TPA: hypothetical protein VM165_25545, partial [Planctomycetaceae bacterium]|nr:hypothetical protein [Planctomycetaceae bacterium]
DLGRIRGQRAAVELNINDDSHPWRNDGQALLQPHQEQVSLASFGAGFVFANCPEREEVLLASVGKEDLITSVPQSISSHVRFQYDRNA